MRLLYTMYQGNPYSGGQGVYLYQVTKEMARRGHEVHVIAGSPWPHVAEGVTLHKLPSYSFWVHFDDRGEFFGRNRECLQTDCRFYPESAVAS